MAVRELAHNMLGRCEEIQETLRFDQIKRRAAIAGCALAAVVSGQLSALAHHDERDVAPEIVFAADNELAPLDAPLELGITTTTTTAPTPETTTTTTAVPAPVEVHAAGLSQPSSARGAVGADQSWPNCLTPIRPDVTFGIVGVNDGQPFETNRCLVELVAKFKAMNISPGLYVNTSLDLVLADQQNDPSVPCPWLGSAEENYLCPSYRWGYRAGQFAVKAAWDLRVSSREWYMDVETANKWSGSFHQNRVSLLGTMDAVRKSVSINEESAESDVYLAVYSNNVFWRKIMNNLQLPGIHGWYATGKPETEILAFCDDPQYNFTGGGLILVQTVDHTNPGGAIDINLRC